MRPRHNLDTVIQAALGIVDEQGSGALTLSAVAERLGIRTPSLYTHVTSLAALTTQVTARIYSDLAGHLSGSAVGLSGAAAIRAFMHEYRAFSLEWPNRYRMLPAQPGDEPAFSEAAGQLLDTLMRTLRGFGLPDGELVHAARRVRVCADGFCLLEVNRGFGLDADLDDSYEKIIDMVVASLEP
jgi:AcrR family transcriptional regulator